MRAERAWLVAVLLIGAACASDADAPVAEGESQAPELIGPKLLVWEVDCDDPRWCFHTHTYRKGVDVQVQYFAPADYGYVFERRGTLRELESQRLDELISTIDPNATELADPLGLCGNPDVHTTLRLFAGGHEFEYEPHCPPEGVVELALAVDEVVRSLDGCYPADLFERIEPGCR